MRKSYFFAALVATMLASCTDNQEMSDATNGQVPVAFGTYVGKATRADVKTAFAEGDKIGVFGYYTGAADYAATAPNFMYNQAVEKGRSSWTYSPLKYWPNEVTSANAAGKVSFFAYYPMAAVETAVSIATATTTTAAVDPQITYDASDRDKQVDLLWGVEGTSGLPFLNQTKQIASEKITFAFKHALARVGFKIKLGGDIITEAPTVTTVTINKIEFGGDLDADKEVALVGKLTKSATLNLNNTTNGVAIWTDHSTTDAYSLSLGTADFTGNGIFGGTDNAALAAAAEITNDAGKYFMIIPQDFASNATKMRITYTVTTTDAALNGGSSEVENIHVSDVSTNFANGNAYLYTFTIGLNSVKVDATINTWTDATGVDVPVSLDPVIP